MKVNKKLVIIISAIVTVLLIAGILLAIFSPRSSITVTDKNGDTIAVLSGLSSQKAASEIDGIGAFLDVVIDDAIQLIADTDKCSTAQAEAQLLKNNYTLCTSFDKAAFEACKTAFKNGAEFDDGCASVVTTVDGKILAVFSAGRGDHTNLALQKTQPYSSIKPLSVYAPAVENNVVNWSTTYLDAPVKQVESEDGKMRDWPANASGKYAKVFVSLGEGIKHSLNTVAVRCLQDLGVQNSIAFLNKLGINITQEQEVSAHFGDEEVLHNLGMGYLKAGVSPLDMAGYYQIFATDGRYIEPYAVTAITKGEAKIYAPLARSERIISRETAFILNQLLRLPLTDGGTAHAAQHRTVPIGGKTGTGDSNVDNWFVGFTPEYICAVWHGKSSKTYCPQVFADVMAGMTLDETKTFPNCPTVLKIPYCAESGGKLTMSCKQMGVGYFNTTQQPQECTVHKGK